MTKFRDKPMYYYLDENYNVLPVPNDDALVWAKLFEDPSKRIVKHETVNGKFISTVFLGLDHSFRFGQRPLVFETMIFNIDDEYQERCCTWDEALEQHEKAIQWVKENFKNE